MYEWHLATVRMWMSLQVSDRKKYYTDYPKSTPARLFRKLHKKCGVIPTHVIASWMERAVFNNSKIIVLLDCIDIFLTLENNQWRHSLVLRVLLQNFNSKIKYFLINAHDEWEKVSDFVHIFQIISLSLTSAAK